VEPTVEKYLQTFVHETRAVLGDHLVGVYAGGSLALDDFVVGRSDIDLAVVTRSQLEEPMKRAVAARLGHASLACPARGLELVVYRQEVAASGTPEPGFELELNSGSRMDARVTLSPRDRPAADGHFWYGLDRSILATYGLALWGPPAGEVFAGPRPDDVRDLLVASVQWWMTQSADAGSPEEAVLGACRALLWARAGRWVAKGKAGRMLASQRDPHTQLVRRALAARGGGPPPDRMEAQGFQLRVLEELTAGVSRDDAWR
jgi:hypothetical protein